MCKYTDTEKPSLDLTFHTCTRICTLKLTYLLKQQHMLASFQIHVHADTKHIDTHTCTRVILDTFGFECNYSTWLYWVLHNYYDGSYTLIRW